MLSARHGSLPRTQESPSASYYSDLHAEYQNGWLTGGLRAEGFTSPSLGKRYDHISQRYLQFSTSWGWLRLGHGYTMFGEGLLLRGFELPGFLYESRSFRKQHRVIRDFDGLYAGLTSDRLSLRILSAVPVDPLRPPDESDRRTGRLGGAELRFRPMNGLELGAAYLEYRRHRKQTLVTRFLRWNIDPLMRSLGSAVGVEIYSELASEQGQGTFSGSWRRSPHAFYTSIAFSAGIVGGSVEYKDYHRFDLGINDPPPLVRENTELLLNRATHVLNALAETGLQVELYVAPYNGLLVTLNLSRARNHFEFSEPLLFLERYVGLQYLEGPWNLRLFFDSSRDDIVSEQNRKTAGAAVDYTVPAGLTLGADVQWQRIRRAAPPFFDYRFSTVFFAFHLQGWRGWSLGLGVERTGDPDETSATKSFPYFSLAWRPASSLAVQWFWGKRRGGTACDHGYCIEVLEFEGMELRTEVSL